jgi:hypothetical protein
MKIQLENIGVKLNKFKNRIIFVKDVQTEEDLREKLRKNKIKKMAESLKVEDRLKIGAVGNGL